MPVPSPLSTCFSMSDFDDLAIGRLILASQGPPVEQAARFLKHQELLDRAIQASTDVANLHEL